MPLYDLEDYYMSYREKSSIRRAYFIMCALLTILFAVFVVDLIIDEKQFDSAVNCIECGEYEKALEILEDIGGGGFSRAQEESKEALTLYAKARIAYKKGNDFLARMELRDIPNNYEGELCEEIKQFEKIIYN